MTLLIEFATNRFLRLDPSKDGRLTGLDKP